MKSARSAAPRVPKPIDLETRLTDEHHQAVKLWLRLLSCTNLVAAEIRGRLRAEFGISLPRFDLMAQLERHPSGLKMNQLSRRLMVSGGNVTGLTDQLEKEGLVTRADDPDDRRAYTVKLTPTGRALFARMAAVHEEWVIELFSGMTAADKVQVHRQLAKLKLHVASVSGQRQSKEGKGARL